MLTFPPCSSTKASLRHDDGVVLTQKKRVLIADDHALLAEGIAWFLATEYEVVGIAVNGIQLITQASVLRPDIIILDISMPGMNGIEAARQIHKIMPEAKLIFLTQQIDPQYVHAAFQAGGSGYVAKHSASAELIAAVRKVAAGGTYITPLLEEKLGYMPVTELRKESAVGYRLTTRQREVLQMVSEGKTSKEIAGALGISAKTVEFHKKALMDQTGLRTTAELTRYALSTGVVSM